MSTSARDHFIRIQAQDNLALAVDESDDRAGVVEEDEELVQLAQEDLARRQEALRRSRHSLMESEVAAETALEELQLATETVTAAKSKPAGTEIDPNTGLPEGEKIMVYEKAHVEYVEKTHHVWQLLKDYQWLRFCDKLSEEEKRQTVAMSSDASDDKLRQAAEQLLFIVSMTNEELKQKLNEKWEEIKAAERQVTVTLKSTDYVVSRRLLGIGNGAVQATSTEFVPPYTVQPDEIITQTMNYAKSNPEKTKADPKKEMFDLICFMGPIPPPYPDGVCNGVMKMIQKQRSELEQYHLQQQANRADDDDSSDGGDLDHRQQHANEDVDGVDEVHAQAIRVQAILEQAIRAGGYCDDGHEDDDETEFEMTNDVWSAIGSAVRNEVVTNRNQTEAELSLPREDSAPIARYNPQAHFLFQSEMAKASVKDLDEAIICCKLRSRPESSESSAQPVLTQLPYEIDVGNPVSCLDLDGGTLAMCGDNEFNAGRIYAAAMSVPYPTKLDKSNNIGEDKVASPGNCEPLDTRKPKTVYKGRKQYFEKCIADEKNDRLWASSSRKGIICGYSTADDIRRKDRPVGVLSFDAIEKKLQRKYVNSRLYIAKCGDFIVGSAGSNRLSIWNGQKAVDEFQFPEETEHDEDSDSDHSEGIVTKTTNKNIGERKRLCSGRLKRGDGDYEYKGLSAHILTIEAEGCFSTGDVQALDESNLIVAPERGDSSTEEHSQSIRLVDLASEEVVGLFCGNQGPVSIEKQYCAKETSMIFTADGGTSFVWDSRTFRPAMLLHSRGARDVRILGIPGSSSMAAFTFGPYMECIECWDLRMPICHAYTMTTGNANVTDLFWHHRTSSLLAMACSDHTTSYVRFGTPYMYGEPISDSAAEVVWNKDWWPPAAQHEPQYFGPNHWNLYRPTILQYSFKGGSTSGPACSSEC